MTDTWFAEHGKVFNIGVSPYAEVQIRPFSYTGQQHRITIYAENYKMVYAPAGASRPWGPHPLLEAAIELMKIPDDLGIHVSIFCDAPTGASTGTSAAIAVALVGALDVLTPGRLSPHEIAYKAHAVETDLLNWQCGIQDQMCSAFGGINYIEMFKYPWASVSRINLPLALKEELQRRLVLIYLGTPHVSSQMHDEVIAGLGNAGPMAKQLVALRATAEMSRDALYAGDLHLLGQAMLRCTEAQQGLHPRIVNAEAKRVFEIASAHGALGWKVNGAGGEGGSVTILCGAELYKKRAMIREIEADNSLFRHIPIRMSDGLRVWEAESTANALFDDGMDGCGGAGLGRR